MGGEEKTWHHGHVVVLCEFGSEFHGSFGVPRNQHALLTGVTKPGIGGSANK
jgi:hypothetical protein